MYIDSHAHLDFPDFQSDLETVLARAREAGVQYIINIGTSLEASRQVVVLSEKYPRLFAAVGIHPHDAEKVKESNWPELEKLAAHPKVVGIGEIGLDYHKNLSPKDAQRAVFLRQLQLVKKLNKPVIIHAREAHEECLEILKTNLTAPIRGVMHCFSGTAAQARQYLDLGFNISIAGPVTYPNANNLRAVVKTIPVERLLLETDCPFLAPQQRRGLRNEPAYVVWCAEEFARLYGLSIDDIARITSHNAQKLFGIPKATASATIAYNIRNALYLNITNKCTAACTFCVREFTDYVKGHNLRLTKEPTVGEIIESLGDFQKYEEVVFCGYGEPTTRLEELKEVARYLKKHQMTIRLNTNGHGNLIHNRSILPELKGLIDRISVSLPAPDAESYLKVCRPKFGRETFGKVLEFIKEAKQYIPEVEITTVTYPGNDPAHYGEIARTLGVKFRPRGYNEVG